MLDADSASLLLLADRLERAGRAEHHWPTPGAMAVELDPKTRTTPALELIDDELVALADGDNDRLMLFMPPQEGKSQKVSRRFPAWLLADDPTLRIAIVSYADNKARRWGRQIRRDIRTHPQIGIMLQPDSQASDRWETTAGGGLICVGISGGITGEPVDVLIIDDPIRGRAEAESITYREQAWDWWESNGFTRLSSRGRVVLMMTRWHADDLAGRLIEREPDTWRVVSIPALAEIDDPLGRDLGDELQSVQRRKPGYFTGLATKRSPYVFRSVYQQRPVAAEGSLFGRGDWQFWRPLAGERVLLDPREMDLRDMWRFITVDLAASVKTSADWTVATCWALSLDGDLIVLDRKRDRAAPDAHIDLVEPLRSRWAVDTVFVESRMFGTSLVIDLTRRGVPVSELDADVDKVTRAIPAANLVKQRRVWLPAAADWLDDWLDEHAEFPNSRYDDQVDTTGYAARVALAQWNPAGQPAVPTVMRPDPFDSETTDYMAIPY